MDIQGYGAERLFCFQYLLEALVKVGCIFCPGDGVFIGQTDQCFDILAKDTASAVKQHIHEDQHQCHKHAKDGQSISQGSGRTPHLIGAEQIPSIDIQRHHIKMHAIAFVGIFPADRLSFFQSSPHFLFRLFRENIPLIKVFHFLVHQCIF